MKHKPLMTKHLGLIRGQNGWRYNVEVRVYEHRGH